MNDNNEIIRSMVARAVRAQEFELDVSFDVGFGWGPTGPNSPGQLTMGYWVCVSIPNPLLGQTPLNNVVLIGDFIPKPTAVNDLIQQALTHLREMKNKILSGADGKKGLTNG